MKKIAFAFLAVLGLNTAMAQENNDDTHDLTIVIPEVALLDIESSTSKNFTMEFTAPTEAGLPIVQPTINSSIWLNVSSIVLPSETRIVTAKLSQNLTNGAILSVFNMMFPMGSVGNPGFGMMIPQPNGLSTADSPIISNVTSGYTGDGVGSGFQLFYTAAVSPSPNGYSLLKASNETVTVTFTLSDN